VKTIGIVRQVDELGRIVLPAELRRTMEIGEKELMEIFVEGEDIVLRKYRPACVFCNSSRDIALFRGKNICSACREKIAEFQE